MNKKCAICGKKIEETFLGKINGTQIYIKNKDKKEITYVCSECQKQRKNLKEQLSQKPA